MSDAFEETAKPAATEATEPKATEPEAGKSDAGKIESAEPAHRTSAHEAAASAEPVAHQAASGTALAPAAEAPTGIDPFLAQASDPAEPAAPRPFYAKALDYSAHAAMIVGLIGFAWTVSDHVTSRKPAVAATAKPVRTAEAAAPAAPMAKPAGESRADDLGELRRTNQKMAAEIRGLHASLEALRTTVVRERGGEDVRSLSGMLDQVKASLAAARAEQTTQIAQLTGKVDKLQRDTRQQVAARGETRAPEAKPERREVDTSATASIPGPAKPATVKPVPTPPTKPTTLASVESMSGRGEPDKGDDGKPQVIAGWVVREVYQGVALIEGRRGSMEVVPGVSIPGAGIVKSIDRHGAGWTVTTTKGQLAYAATPHEPHRGYRDYYGPRRYDF